MLPKSTSSRLYTVKWFLIVLFLCFSLRGLCCKMFFIILSNCCTDSQENFHQVLEFSVYSIVCYMPRNRTRCKVKAFFHLNKLVSPWEITLFFTSNWNSSKTVQDRNKPTFFCKMFGEMLTTFHSLVTIILLILKVSKVQNRGFFLFFFH